MRLKKKSQLEIISFATLEIILAIVVVLAFFWTANSIKDKTVFHRQFLTRDTALTVNTIYSSPNDIYYWYEPSSVSSIKFSKFDYELKDGVVNVVDNNLKNRYPYLKTLTIESKNDYISKPSKINLYKTNNIFYFTDSINPDYYSYSPNLSDISKDIFNDISFISSIDINPVTKEKYLEGESFFLYERLHPSSINTKIKGKDVYSIFNILLSETNDMIFAVSTYNNSKEDIKENIKIYFSAEDIKDKNDLRKVCEKISDYINIKDYKIPLIPIESKKDIILILTSQDFLEKNPDKIPLAISSFLEEIKEGEY